MAMTNIHDQETWEQFSTKLLDKTQAATLVWEDWSARISRRDAISPLFVAEYKDWYILIYQYEWKTRIDDSDIQSAIELIDLQGRNRWTVPTLSVGSTLFDQVQFQAERVLELLDTILADQDTLHPLIGKQLQAG